VGGCHRALDVEKHGFRTPLVMPRAPHPNPPPQGGRGSNSLLSKALWSFNGIGTCPAFRIVSAGQVLPYGKSQEAVSAYPKTIRGTGTPLAF
jgi:hypothetical protein